MSRHPVSRLVQEAKQGATLLKVRPNEVNAVVEHIMQTTSTLLPAFAVRHHLIEGEVKLAGVPVEVIGARQCAS